MGNHLINTIDINLYIWAFEFDMLIQQVRFCDICSRLPITIHIFHVKFDIVVYNILRIEMHYWLIYSLCHLVNILSNAKRPWIFQWTVMASIFDIFQIKAIQNILLIFLKCSTFIKIMFYNIWSMLQIKSNKPKYSRVILKLLQMFWYKPGCWLSYLLLSFFCCYM